MSGSWLNYVWKKNGKRIEQPGPADVLYHAGTGIVERALRPPVSWVVVVSAMYLHPDWLVILKRAGLKVAAVLTECPYDDGHHVRMAPYIDLLWANDRGSLPTLRSVHPNVQYLPTAWDQRKHYPGLGADREVTAHDVVFVGTGFQERIDLLSKVNWDGIDLGLYGNWRLLPSRHPLRRYVRDREVNNEVTAALYRRAQVGLNLYRTSVGFGRQADHTDLGESLNPRAYELAACGLFHLSEYRPEVIEHFHGRVPVFRDAAELETKLRWWLGHPEERAAYAKLLPPDVVNDHYGTRAQQVVRDLAAAEPGSEASNAPARLEVVHGGLSR
jgi:spore maturation protein CgeB